MIDFTRSKREDVYDNYRSQEEIKNLLFEQLTNVKITEVEQKIIDNAYDKFQYRGYQVGIITIYYEIEK
jgi:hypothetical protein